MATNGNLKCHLCPECNGLGCIGELPGLGGVYDNKNFQLNCEGWQILRNSLTSSQLEILKNIDVSNLKLRCGPVTGAVENIGYSKEENFYYPYLKAASDEKIGLCVGDGYPDEKLNFGLNAISKINTKAAFFLKPYPDEILQKRIIKIRDYAQFIGFDIDSYNILTMRKLVNLEKKTPLQLENLRKSFDCPLVIKGIFTQEDIELVKEVKPDVVYISNHGGRVETRIGSVSEFLLKNSKMLKNYCSQIWVDGGIRSKIDVQTALYFGADQVIIARPFIHSVFTNGIEGMRNTIKGFLN
ncbi:MAG: FMN-dependent dehydrogenase [Treponema sp.]|nr:FMN-dependent dehydrogenase [Treponema sp.]